MLLLTAANPGIRPSVIAHFIHKDRAAMARLIEHGLRARLDVQSLLTGQLLIALAMIIIMLLRPRGLWPSPEHGKAAPQPVKA